MLYLEDFLELLEQLPSEIRDRTTDIRMLDLKFQHASEKLNSAIRDFFNQLPNMTEEERKRRYSELKKEFQRIREDAKEKVTLSDALCELLEKYQEKLNKEILHFKFELEADNPGITEQIERRFFETERALIQQRKEKRRRPLETSSTSTSSEVNGTVPHIKREVCSPAPSRSSATRSVVGEISQVELITSNQNSRSSFGAHEEEVGSSGSVRHRSSHEPDVPPLKLTVKRSATNPSKLIAVSSVSSSPALSSLSPNRERGDRGSSASLSSSRNLNLSSASKGGPATGTSASLSSGPSMPPNGSPILAFAGQESRHGRPRKLTTRVREMINDSLQRHERRIPSHYSPEPAEDGSDVEEEDSEPDNDNDRRTWCICHQKSYGCMVACDNKDCPFEWFHYECVRLTQPPKGKWYCPRCAEERQRRSLSADMH
ncbi:hypothetical protein AB6A40_000486 [Gnathostoma spinigerum]|uniref:Inhibitor of growth protein n=1 Tax=Gnathostoma spinigerum TaxID=75299 RepID=A0ABD6EBB7_9BILA